MRRIAATEPLDNTKFPHQDIIKSFAEISRNYLSEMLESRSLPHNRSVRIMYNDGNISSNEICEAMLISCRSFGLAALIESEINYLEYKSEDIIKLTYNRIISEDFSSVGIETPIKAIIVKDYEKNQETYGQHIEEQIKCYVHNLNHRSLLGTNEYYETRRTYPCFFLIN